ncbi:MAG: transposase [Patescibacteria group bacterium]
MRKIKFANGEFYHIYNRGVDKRQIFCVPEDLNRFLESMTAFNSITPVGSLHSYSFQDYQLSGRTAKLVNIVCYCLNPNHYHIVLEQLTDGGVSEFIKRLAGGYTFHFNTKYKRSGVLFQGKFKASHIDSNEYLLHVSSYVNLNNRVHRLSGRTAKSSWEEYMGTAKSLICKKDIILSQFKTKKEYKDFAESSLVDILERKQQSRDISDLLLE